MIWFLIFWQLVYRSGLFKTNEQVYVLNFSQGFVLLSAFVNSIHPMYFLISKKINVTVVDFLPLKSRTISCFFIKKLNLQRHFFCVSKDEGRKFIVSGIFRGKYQAETGAAMMRCYSYSGGKLRLADKYVLLYRTFLVLLMLALAPLLEVIYYAVVKVL